MATVSYPGVYVEEIPGGARPIESGSTSTAAFVGLNEQGPDDAAVKISSWDEYRQLYGGFIAASYLPESVFSFFNNGGRQCYIVRVTRSDAGKADVTLQNRAVAAVNAAVKPGPITVMCLWGNAMLILLCQTLAQTVSATAIRASMAIR